MRVYGIIPDHLHDFGFCYLGPNENMCTAGKKVNIFGEILWC